MKFGFRFGKFSSGGIIFAGVMLAWGVPLPSGVGAEKPFASYGLDSRPAAKPYLQMPDRADGVMPKLLSQTGAFQDTQSFKPDGALIPYDLIVPFWSDGAAKTRWVSVPGEKIKFAPTGEWVFPKGTVFVKTFTLATNELNPDSLRRLETRLLVCDAAGGVYGVTYKWRADNSDADLLTTNLTETIAITTATGVRTQAWYYPSRADCLTCHTPLAGLVLGVKTRQLNRDFTYPAKNNSVLPAESAAARSQRASGVAPEVQADWPQPEGITDNQLRAWNHVGLFDTNLAESDIKNFPTLANAADTTRSLEDRARSYLDANCANCHRPRGTVAFFDARYDTPLAQQGLIGGRVLIDQRIDGARVIAPNDIWRSILFMRANTAEAFKMPQLARNQVDAAGMNLLRQWIESLPGPPVLQPPEISPRGGNFAKPVEVVLKSEPGATIRYTVDGTVPTTSDLLYEKPIQLTAPTILRAKAFKAGFTKSITTQEIFLVGG
jgi:mono/diheme cytochrome c family protein